MTAGRFQRYVALGDSFTEGLHDAWPDGTPRGWADLVAGCLAAAGSAADDAAAAHCAADSGDARPPFRYANLAVRSKRIDEVVAQQLPTALAMEPDLVTFAAGGNDILGLRVDLDHVCTRMDEAVRALRGTGATVVVFTGFDPRAQLPPGRFLAGRTAEFNQAVRASAARHGARVVDLWSMLELLDPRMWSHDRLHLSTLGHHHVAAVVLDALGVPAPAAYRVALDPAPSPAWVHARAAELAWARRHFAPWAWRKLRGRSMGDGRSAKLPSLTPWPAH